MNKKNHVTCDKCKDYGLQFRSKHKLMPVEAIDGNVNADIWIIGLNPKAKVGHIEERNLNDFKLFNPNGHRYFRDFRKVSEKLYKNWTRPDRNIAHTDLVKCFSDSFPPGNLANGKNIQRQIIDNCVGF